MVLKKMVCFGLTIYSLVFRTVDDMICADANVTYYVSGYVGRSISFRRKCSSCKEFLIAGDDYFSIHHYLPDEYKQLFKNINRGGLPQQFEFIYIVIVLALQHCMVILSILEPTKTKFFSVSNQRSFIHSSIYPFIQ